MSPVYHLSYDAIDIEKHFGKGNYDEAKRYLLCVLKKTRYFYIDSLCESTLIIAYENEQPRLFDYLEENLEKYFYYFISEIAETKTEELILEGNLNSNLSKSFKEDLKNINCNNLNKSITAY